MDPINCVQVCRICTNHGTNYTSIFDANPDCIDEKINQCLPISVNKYDKLPSHICSECLNALINSDKLRKKSLESDKLLREQFNLTEVKIKSEKDDNCDDDELIFCGICEINFENAVQFDEHMEKSHLSKWTCNLCDENFKTSDDLFQHKYTSHYDNIENDEKTDENIENFVSKNDTSIDDDKSIDIKDEPPPSTSDNSFTAKPGLKTVMICDLCNVSVDNEKQMVYHRKFHAPRAMTCWTCDIKYPSAYDYFIHKQDVHKHYKGQIKKYCCENCDTFVSCFTVFRKHINCQYTKLKCQYCEREFSRRIEFFKHQKRYHREDMMKDLNCKKWKCSICEKVFINSSSYRDHMRAHINKNKEKYKCEQCDKFFSNSAHLKAHREGIHEKLPKYQCDSCYKWFCTRPSLQEHKKRHLDQTCQGCNKEFENLPAFSAHMKEAHNVIFPAEGRFACKQCPRKFPKIRLLHDHENTHSRKEPYSCEICHKRFRTYAARWSHEQGHKREAYTCDYCQQKFKGKNHLARHIFGHFPPENWKYQCKVCKVKFKSTWHLNGHMRVHSVPSR